MIGMGDPTGEVTGRICSPRQESVTKPILPCISSRILIVILWLISELTFLSLNCHSAGASKSSRLPRDRVSVHQIEPDPRGGKVYKLIYRVRVPIEVYWRFKTDFDNDFLLKNESIRRRRVISSSGSSVAAEDKYAHAADVFFRWQTTGHRDIRRRDSILLNP